MAHNHVHDLVIDAPAARIGAFHTCTSAATRTAALHTRSFPVEGRVHRRPALQFTRPEATRRPPEHPRSWVADGALGGDPRPRESERAKPHSPHRGRVTFETWLLLYPPHTYTYTHTHTHTHTYTWGGLCWSVGRHHVPQVTRPRPPPPSPNLSLSLARTQVTISGSEGDITVTPAIMTPGDEFAVDRRLAHYRYTRANTIEHNVFANCHAGDRHPADTARSDRRLTRSQPPVPTDPTRSNRGRLHSNHEPSSSPSRREHGDSL
eukprot:2642998-Prymnesium_polylepis.1